MAKTRKRGPIKCKPGSDEAKRIEETHGFIKAMEARDNRDDAANKARPSKKSAAAKGDT